MRKKAFFTSLLLLCVSYGKAQDSDEILQYFPGQRLFPILTADARAHRFSLSAITKNREWIGTVGGALPLLRFNRDDVMIQGSVEASIVNRLIKEPGRLTVYTIDYKVDLPVDFHFSQLTLRAALGHLSCHFSDDAIEILGESSIQHVNDYVTLGATYDIEPILGFVYTVVNYSYGTQPVRDKPLQIQFGSDFANLPLVRDVYLFGAFDVKIKEEVGWGTTQSYQLGFKLFPRMNYLLRIAYTYRTGYDERGQFYLNRDSVHLISAFVDF